MREYALAAIAGMWLADGVSLLIAPRFVITRIRAVVDAHMALWPWQLLSAVMGTVLGIAGLDLRHQPLWMLCAGGMILKGLFLAFGPALWRERALAWSLSREDVDYRFWGLGLCTLAALLLQDLGWIGEEGRLVP